MNWIALGSVFLGLWLLAAPFTLGYSGGALGVSDLISGGVLILAGITSKRIWGCALVGLWLGLAPLVFWAKEPACYLNDTVVGLLSLVLVIASRNPSDEGPSIPPGWSYNPSSWPQRIPIAFLAFFGWMCSRFMAAYQLGYIDAIWDPFFGDGTRLVITSSISKKFPVPDAGLGAFAYSLEFLSVFKGGERRWRTMPWMVVLFGILAIPLGLTSIFLILLQPLVVGAWCSFCLATALCMALLVALSIDEVTAVCQYLRSGEKPFLQLFFKGGVCPGAKKEKRLNSLEQPFKALLKEGFQGVSFSWGFALLLIMGAFLMAFPSLFALDGAMAKIDPIIGVFQIAATFVAMADPTRKVRGLNLPFAIAIFVGALITGEALFAHIGAALLSAFALFKTHRLGTSLSK